MWLIVVVFRSTNASFSLFSTSERRHLFLSQHDAELNLMKLLCSICSLAIVCAASVSGAQPSTVSLRITDSDSGKPIAARVYLRDETGEHYFFTSSDEDGSAVPYKKKNWLNKNSIEYHTTVSAHRCQTVVPPGTYTLRVERGKTYHPWERPIQVSNADLQVSVVMKRWIDTAALGWYSGDAHVHRTIDELRNIVLAEDLNVVFPLTQWVTISDTPPSSGNKNIPVNLPDSLIRVDKEHVIWPRNTEYEIFSVNKKRHTLGALFLLGHEGALQQTVPPWKGVIDSAREADPDVLFDMDKLAWPFAMVLPTIVPDATYEVTNNHIWRTEFAFRDWYTPTPPFMQPPFGGTSGGERQWIDFTLGMYYTLLDCGFRMPASAGTANGVHPVPAGFGRVYVHLPDGFDYQQWRKGLKQGRSFVTTGPMLFATADGHDPGHQFQFDSDSQAASATMREIRIHIEVESQQPLTFGELVINGRPEHLLRVQNTKTEAGAYRSVIDQTISPTRSGWFAVRFWEDRPHGRVRFAHTAPWYVEVDQQRVLPRHEEKQYLVRRMENEIQRSRGVVSESAMAEYLRALDFYRALPVLDDTQDVQRAARVATDPADHARWLENMILHHRFTPHEVRMATGMSIADATTAVQKMLPIDARQPGGNGDSADTKPVLRILPYPGGRHVRRGFLDGAIDPQRETKVSVFPPWNDGGYAVVDIPEAIFSNLGLTYLAHKHIPTIWTEKAVTLEKLEWKQAGDGLEVSRKLPNGISFGSRVTVQRDTVAMEMWLTNGTTQPLTALRSQVCVMMKGMIGFNTQRRREQVIDGSFVAVKADDSQRWIITAWEPIRRAWTNPPVPCMHSDPIFPDCQPGKTVRVRGGLWFYEGADVKREIERRKSYFDRIRPYAANARYWQYRGQPVLLVGGSKDDNLFQRPDLQQHLDEIQAAGGNYIRNTMSDRRTVPKTLDSGATDAVGFEVYPFKKLASGKYDLDQWNEEYWNRFANLLKWTKQRGIIVQIEVWDRFDYTDFRGFNAWRAHPYNPANNVNYTAAESGLAKEYAKQHPSRDQQPFFHTIPGMDRYRKSYDVLRKHQERFVDQLLSYSLPYGNVLYCMNNETSSSPKWGQHWIGRVQRRAAERGVDVFTTDMFDDGFNPASSEKIRVALDTPGQYKFIDISQVNSRNFNEDHWDKLLWYDREIRQHPRPLNNTKIYGSGETSWGSGTPEDGVERFWRNIIAGCASARFHRDGAGNGLKPIAKASIAAVRQVESRVKFWEISHHNDLLRDRESDEAYLACRPGVSYVLYFTEGGTVGLDLQAYPQSFDLHWINIAGPGSQAKRTVSGGGISTISAPDQGPWVAVLIAAP